MANRNLQLNVVNYNKGAYITIEGKASNNCFYIIRMGSVQVTREALRNETETLKTGDFFGVISAMSGHDHIETSVALTDVSLIMVVKDQFPLLIQKNNPVAMKIILSFSRKLRELDTSIAELTLKSISTEDVVNLMDIGEYYMKLNQFNQAFYAFYRFIQHCPDNSNVPKAKQFLLQIKPKSKAVYLDAKNEFKRVYPDDTMVFCEHEPGNELYILQSGKIKITKIIDNKEVLLAVLKEGDIFGEMALLENKPRSASAISYGESHLMVVNKENFKNMISGQPQLVTRLICLLAERTWVVYRQLSNLQIKSKLGRTYDVLLLQLEKNKIPIKYGSAYLYDFGPKELINMVGLSKEEGREIAQEIFKNRKFQLVDNKISVTDIEEIKKQVDYFKKMEAMESKRKAGKESF